MKQVHLTLSPKEIDYRKAVILANTVAEEDKEIGAPVLVAWYDRKAARMSPAIAGGNLRTRWHDYGASHGGCIEVDVGGDYSFIYADGSAFEGYGPSPYVNLWDRQGNEYICQTNMLSDPHSPSAGACVAIDEWTSKLT